ncbi:MAG: serine--tRNA ligase [Flavobacteriales bacterium]|nr:serine--tRNA ligase [Flavobacteriales bacterium]
MLTIAIIRQERDQLVEDYKRRNLDVAELLDQVLELDELRRATQKDLDGLLAQSNEISKKIGELFKSGQHEEGNALRKESAGDKDAIAALKDQMNATEEQITQVLYQIPNRPHSSVPQGKSDEDNEEINRHGDIPSLYEGAVPHWDLASKYNLIDFELGVKITGAGFPVYRGKGARLQRALINFFLDEARDAGYEEFIPPHLVNQASGIGTGQLPDKEGQMYHAVADDLYLIPTAEVPLTNIFRDVILRKEDFPIKLCGYTPCFRREAGSYGKDVRGLNRLHQFDKVEIVQLQHPELSYSTLDQMVAHVQGLLKKLNLPYRTLRLCGGDLGFAAALTFDLEVFSAAQKRWLEVSSVSNFETFQTNRLKCRFKNKEGKTELAHSLNGSALALPRILAALLENNQFEGGIRIPEVLVPYCGFDAIEG